MYNNDLFKMNLQLFADEPQTEHAQQETAPETEPAAERKYTQAEVDAAIASRLSRANKDAEKRIEAARQEARSEAEKLAKMNAEQRAEHERQEAEKAAKEREAEITRREADISRRELMATAKDELSKREIPIGFHEILNYTDADTCNASIDALAKLLAAYKQDVTNKLLAGSGVTLRMGSNQPDPDKMTDAEWFAYRKAQRQQKG